MVAAAGATALLAGACFTNVDTHSATDPATAAGSGVSARTLNGAVTSVASTEIAINVEAATVERPTTEIPTTTRTWVEFETVPSPLVHHGLRVPQGDADTKGAMFEIDAAASQSRQESEAAGVILDLCRLEDALIAEHWPNEVPEPGELSLPERRELARSFLGRDCRGADTALAEPLLGYWPSRYRVFGTYGLEGTFFPTRDEAVAWYERHEAAQQMRYGATLPRGAELYGSFGYSIEYSGRDNPVDEVRVLDGTMGVTGGVLRGLVRNWSRTMWAYGMRVEAGGREFLWPLSIQPGEVAPFEIDDWDGPADPGSIDVAVFAEMSNDGDVSRAWWMAPYPQVMQSDAWQQAPGWYRAPPQDVLDDLPADTERLVSASAHYSLSDNRPDSHPSLHGELAEDLEFELAVFVAFFGDDGIVLDVQAVTPYSEGRRLLAPPDGVLPRGAEYSVDSYGERDGRVHYAPFAVRRYPVPELGVRGVSVLFDGTADADWVMWIGADHNAAAS